MSFLNVLWLVLGLMILVLFGLIFVWWRVTHRAPALRLKIEHRRAGYRGWEDDIYIPSPRYDLILRWVSIGIGVLSLCSCGTGAYLMAQVNQPNQPSDNQLSRPRRANETQIPTQTLFAISTADGDLLDLVTETLPATFTPTATNTPRATRTPRVTVSATLDGAGTMYPTYTPYPTLTPHLMIVTPVDQQRPTSAPYVPQAQQSSYARLVPDQRGQTTYQQPQTVYQQPYQPQYMIPTAQFIIPSWEDYITSTPRPTDTPAPTQTPYMVVVTSMPESTFTATMTPAPTQTPHIIIITNTPEPTATETMTSVPTATPTQTPITPTDTPMPTATATATDTPAPTATPEPSPTPVLPTTTPEPTDEPTNDH